MACVYIIRHNESDNCYIGSTKDFEKRKIQHERKWDKGTNKNYIKMLYQFISDNGGFDNFTIEKLYDLKDGENKYEKEQEYMDMYKPSLNNQRAFGLDIEKRKEYNKEYNKDYKKEYYEKNKNKIIEYRGQYYEKNKERIKERVKEYNNKNKDKIYERRGKRIECPCGMIYTLRHKARHFKTRRHQSYLQNHHNS